MALGSFLRLHGAKMIKLMSKAQRRTDAYRKAKMLQALEHGKPAVTNVIPYKVTIVSPAVARGSNYLHRKTARALPLNSWRV